MSDATFPHSPVLSEAAPGLLRSLRNLITERELVTFTGVYHICVELGASQEGPVRRAEAEAFNPRPARVCKILLRECQESHLRVLLAALLGSLNYDRFSNIDSLMERTDFSSLQADQPVVGEALLLHSEWQSFLNEPGSALSHEAERIFLALMLDQLRHLHMSSLDIHEQIMICQSIAGDILKLPCHPSNVRLLQVVQAALKRAALRLDCPENFLQVENC